MSQISDYMHDPEVRKVQLLCENPERYAIRFDDGSAMLTDGEGNRIESPLSKFDFINKVEYIGRLEGKPHFAYEGREATISKITASGNRTSRQENNAIYGNILRSR